MDSFPKEKKNYLYAQPSKVNLQFMIKQYSLVVLMEVKRP